MSFTACNAHLRCANQGIVRILLLPGANTMNAPNVHKCTSARSPSMAKRTLRMTFMACQGSKVKLWGVPGPDQARPTQCALFGPKVKGQKVSQNPPRTYYLASGRRSTEHAKGANRVASGSRHRSTEHAKRANRVATTTCWARVLFMYLLHPRMPRSARQRWPGAASNHSYKINRRYKATRFYFYVSRHLKI